MADTEQVWIRLTKEQKRAVELAATAEEIPVSTWIRNQIMASLYLSGVATAPQVIYEGFRHSIQDLADNLQEVTLAVRAWPAMLEHVIAASLVAGGLNPEMSATMADRLIHEALSTVQDD